MPLLTRFLFTRRFPNKPKGEKPGDFCFPAMHPTAVLPANLLIFAARMQEVSGAVTLRQVPEAHKKRNTYTYTSSTKTTTTTQSNTLLTIWAYTDTEHKSAKTQAHGLWSPALLFCSSRFNWGFEPGSCLSHCDKLKIALWQVSEKPAGIRLCILGQMGWLARGIRARGLQTGKETKTATLPPMLGRVPVSRTCCKKKISP